MTTLLKEKNPMIRILVCSNENYLVVKAIAKEGDIVHPVVNSSITSDLARKLELNLQGRGNLTVMFPSNDEIAYLKVDVSRKWLKEAIETINITFQDGVVLRSRM